MTMASTPPPVSMRARTPPTPRHGPMSDDYEPYSPRRSTRRTLARNPYSSFNKEPSIERKTQRSGERTPARRQRGIATPPPTSLKKRARFAEPVPQLSSPPSSPIGRSVVCKTPQRNTGIRNASVPIIQDAVRSSADSDPEPGPTPVRTPFTSASAAQVQKGSSAALLTPTKTPTRRTPATSRQRRNFNIYVQPDSPNAVMPPSRKIIQTTEPSDFELNLSPSVRATETNIDIYTDSQARVPKLDLSSNNPFITTPSTAPNMATTPMSANTSAAFVDSKMSTPPPTSTPGGSPIQQTARPPIGLSREERVANRAMESAARRGDGIIFMQRGKKIFRPFAKTRTYYMRDPGFPIGRSLKYNPEVAPWSMTNSPGVRPRHYPTELIDGEDSDFASTEASDDDTPGGLASMPLPLAQAVDAPNHVSNNADEEAETDIEMSDAPSTPTPATSAATETVLGKRSRVPVCNADKPLVWRSDSDSDGSPTPLSRNERRAGKTNKPANRRTSRRHA